jgi:hypothetical protein
LGPIVLGPPTEGETTLVEVYGVRDRRGIGILFLGIAIITILVLTRIGGTTAYYGTPVGFVLILVGIAAGFKKVGEYIEGNCQKCGTSSENLQYDEGQYYCPNCVAKAMQLIEQTVGKEQTSPQSIREVIKKKETIREIVKIRCRHCGALYEERLNYCPRCGAPQ